MTLVSHPTGNTFVRALLSSLSRVEEDIRFHTTLGFSERSGWFKCLPSWVGHALSRRSYDLAPDSCRFTPTGETGRLLLNRLFSPAWVEQCVPSLAPRGIYRRLDLSVARHLLTSTEGVSTLHAYEDGARYSFLAAAERGIRRVYHLPIAYWATSQRILREEAARWPEWIPTLGGGLADARVEENKAAELELASEIVCPSEFVLRSLPEPILHSKRCLLAPFGSPSSSFELPVREQMDRPLRVLFAGSFTQRKGLADLLAGVKQLARPDVELVLAGSPILPLEFYRRQYPNFRYEPSRSHSRLLELMRQCDLLALPSLVEGRALVQQEAMSNGLPILITPNTGGEDLIEPGTGFLVPIRRPDCIAERIDWLADHRSDLPEMRRLATAKAAEYTWERYGETVLGTDPVAAMA